MKESNEEFEQISTFAEEWQTYTIFLQCRDIKDDLKKYKRDITTLVSNHLREFRRYSDRFIGKEPAVNSRIETVCKAVCNLLTTSTDLSTEFYTQRLWDEDMHLELYKGSPSEAPYQFQAKWLKNVSLLLPDDPQIIEILPFLLTCYMDNANKNRLDPFDGKVTIAWQEIFQIYEDDIIKANIKEGGGNRSRYISTLCDHFVHLEAYKYADLIHDEGYECNTYGLTEAESDDILTEAESEAVLATMQSASGDVDVSPEYESIDILLPRHKRKSDKAVLRQKIATMRCWEAYRRFAACCEACKDENDVNITLSMALFAGSWDLGCDIKNQKVTGTDEEVDAGSHFITAASDAMPQYSQEDIEKDGLRNDILRFMRKSSCPDESPNIHEIAYWMRQEVREHLENKPIFYLS